MKEEFVTLFIIPEISGEFCFGGSIPHTFRMIDWFNMPSDASDELIKSFLKPKRYYEPGQRILILGRSNFSKVIICD